MPFNPFYMLAVLFLLISCANNHETDPVIEDPVVEPCIMTPAPVYLAGDTSNGWVKGLKNCLPFNAKLSARLFSKGGLWGFVLDLRTFENAEPFMDKKEEILVGGLSLHEGVYPMYNSNTNEHLGHYFIWYDYDSVEAIFELDTAFKNEIEYTLVDLVGKKLKGIFRCQFVIKNQKDWAVNPDTIRFDNCHFEATIIE